ncbi:MAG: endonuclease/exonuclease/phosphatase family protein [Actinomycetota bacterium]
MKRSAIASAVIVCAAALAPLSTSTPAVAGGPPPVRIRVMSFNIQYGASYSTIDAVVKAIERADADVVGLQEAFGKTRKIARLLGGWYASPRLHLVSRFPIVHPDGSRVAGSPGGRIPEGAWAYLLLGDGAVAAIAQTHTPWWPSGMYAMLQGEDEAEVLAREQGKLDWLQPHLDAVAGPVGAGVPTFFVGDLNTPSHLDWTQEAVDALGWQPPTIDPPGERYVVQWPVTVAMQDAGFADTYREANPDPIAEPGFTYCVRFFPACGRWDTWDRIDYVYSAGPIGIVRSQVVGEGGPFTDIRSRPWPTDHRAVVSTVDVTAVLPETFAAPLDERTWAGRRVQVAFHDPASPDRTIGLWPIGADPETDPAAVDAAVDDAADDGIVSLDTDGLDPGDYIVALLDGGVPATSSVSLVERGAPATIATTERRYERGEPIRVEWTGAPGNRYDWLSLNRNCFDPTSCPLRQWRYVDGNVNGAVRFTRGSEGVWPLRPGRYVVSLCVDDDYVCVATSEIFRVVAP